MSDRFPRTFLILLCVFIIMPILAGMNLSELPASLDDPGLVPEAETSETKSESEAEHSEEFPESSPESEAEPEPGDSLPQTPPAPPEEETETAPKLDMEGVGEYASDFDEPAEAFALGTNERTVKTFAELKSALSEDNGVTIVHLGGDVTMQGGININAGKPHVIIDGLDPANPGQKEPYTLTDLDSAVFTDTIYADSSSISYIHVRDMKIVGKNYYGPFSVLDAPSMAGVKLIFERVDYNGPQLGYHRRGKLYVIDCEARLHGDNGICAVQEFSEARELIFQGSNTIYTSASSNTIFWHPLGGSLTVADDSSVTLRSPNTSTLYGMIYADGSAYNVDITVGRRAVFDAEILNSASSVANVTISGLTVGEGGGFYLTTTGAANRVVLSVAGDITIEPEASFKLASFGGNYPALSLSAGDISVGEDAVFHITSTNTNTSLLRLSGRSFTCEDPASVLFCNPGNRVITAATAPGGVVIDAEQVNIWHTADKSGLDNPPLYQWKKASGENIRIEGTLATGDSGKLSVVSSNYAEGDSPGAPPDGSTLSMTSARVLAFGRLELAVNTPVAGSAEITGVTAPESAVRALLYQQGSEYAMPDATADEHGFFAIPAEISLQPLTDITVISSRLYLTATRAASVGEAGRLEFTVPGELHFYTEKLAHKTQTVKRLNPNWQLLVSDTRGAGNTWSVYVSELWPLTPEDASKPPLENALVFASDTGAVTPLGANSPLLAFRHTAMTESEIVAIGWAAERGILVRVPTGAAYSGQAYTGGLEWTLTDAP